MSRIPVRKMDFKFDENIKKYWYHDDPWTTHFINVLSSVFPDGERFFIDSVRHYRDQITDPELKEQIKAFIGQEAHHGKEHENFNKLLEKKFGFPMKFTGMRVKKAFQLQRKILGPKNALAITIALEHFTAIFADWLLKNPETALIFNEKQADMFLWHAVEETEHKAVAFDVYKKIGGDEFTRKLMMVYTTAFFLCNQFTTTLIWVARDGKLFDIKSFNQFVKFLFDDPGMFRDLIKPYFDYFNSKFHPWDHDNRYLIEEYIEKLKANEVL